MPLTKEEEANAKAVFEALDADGSGKITKDNFKDALIQAGFTAVTDDDVEALIGMVDQDGSGSISYEEFITVVEARPIRRRIEAALRKLFDALDTDGSGFITKADLRSLIDQAGFGDEVTDDDIEALIAQLDDKGDGKVSFDEFMGIFVEG